MAATAAAMAATAAVVSMTATASALQQVFLVHFEANEKNHTIDDVYHTVKKKTEEQQKILSLFRMALSSSERENGKNKIK